MFAGVLVYIGSVSIIYCIWSPDQSEFDFGKLARIMYLYDYESCGRKLRTSTGVANIRLSNDTKRLRVKPIAWSRAVAAVSTRLSMKTRRYIKTSIGIHLVWMTTAILLHIVLRKSQHMRVLKFILLTFLYTSIFVIIFDCSMAAVYIAHIQQSLTKSMVLRYSGWNLELKLKSYDDFAGWLPMAASIVWMRGIVILLMNIYGCKTINHIHRKIKKREVRTKLMSEGYLPVPEPTPKLNDDGTILYYQTGENRPYVKHGNYLDKVFYGL